MRNSLLWLLAFILSACSVSARNLTTPLGTGTGAAARGSNTISFVAGAGLTKSGSPVTIGDASSTITYTLDTAANITWTGSNFFDVAIKALTGSAAAPAYTFTGRTGDGVYSAGIASIGFALGGIAAGTMNSSGLTINAGQFLGPNGTAAAPTFSYALDPDTGFFRSAANVISGAVSATTMFVLNTTGAKFGDSAAPVTTLQVGASGTALTCKDSGGNNVTPSIAHWPTSGVAAIGVGVFAGGRNNRLMMFADDANATVGLSSSYSTNAPSFVFRDTTSEKLRIDPSGNITATVDLVVGAPTGGHKGTGTINLAADIYKNDTAYTNPDYVFEKVFTGAVNRYSDRPRASSYQFLSLQETERYAREHLRLPGISDAPAGMFERSDIALEKIEELYLHVFDLNDRLTRQERWNWAFAAAFVWLYFRTRRQNRSF